MAHGRVRSLYDGKTFSLPCPIDDVLNFEKTFATLVLPNINLQQMDSMRKDMKIAIQAATGNGLTQSAALCETILLYLKQLIKFAHLIQHFPCILVKRPKNKWIRWTSSTAFAVKENEPDDHIASYYDQNIETNNWRTEIIMTGVSFALCAMNFGLQYRNSKKAIMSDGALKAFQMAFTMMNYAICEHKKIRFHEGLYNVPEMKHDVLLATYNAAVSMYLFRLADVVNADGINSTQERLADVVRLGMKAQEFATISLALSRTFGEDPSTEFSIFMANERSRQMCVTLTAKADFIDGNDSDIESNLLVYRLLRTAHEELTNVIHLCEKVQCSFEQHSNLQKTIKEKMDTVLVATAHKTVSHLNYLDVVLSAFDAHTKEIDQIIANATEREKYELGIIVRDPIEFKFDANLHVLYFVSNIRASDSSIFTNLCKNSETLYDTEYHLSDSEDREDVVPEEENDDGKEPTFVEDWQGSDSETEVLSLLKPSDMYTNEIEYEHEAAPLV